MTKQLVLLALRGVQRQEHRKKQRKKKPRKYKNFRR